MAFPKVKLSDDSGNTVGVTSSRLNVNAYLAATPTIDIGDVSLLLGGVAADTGLGAYGAQTLRVTIAADDVLVSSINNWSKAEDAAHSSGDRGIMSLAVRNSSLATLAGTDGDYSPLQVNSGGALYVEAALSSTDNAVLDAISNAAGLQVSALADIKAEVTVNGITGGADDVKTVSNAGTDEALGGDVACKKIDIQAQTDNTGLIAVGFTGVDATVADGTGVILYAGDTYSLEMVNLNLIYIDSTVSGEGVRYTYYT